MMIQSIVIRFRQLDDAGGVLRVFEAAKTGWSGHRYGVIGMTSPTASTSYSACVRGRSGLASMSMTRAKASAVADALNARALARQLPTPSTEWQEITLDIVRSGF